MTNNPDNADRGINTQLTRVGSNPDEYYGFINPPIVRASTVLFPDYETLKNRAQKYTYATRGTPTTDALAQAIDHLEGSAGTIIVPSGLAAVSVPLLAFAKTGDHVLVVDSIYTPTRRFADYILKGFGVDVEYFDPQINGGFSNLLRENTSIVLIEAPGSNTFEMLDVRAISNASHQVDAVVMMDNTWATPLFFKPLDFDVDISIHALTKYPSGHSDLLLGSVSSNEKHWKQLAASQIRMGICAQGDDCYSTLKGLRTMGVRLKYHEQSALQIANWMNGHNQIASVAHPALSDNAGHQIWKRDFSGSSGLFSFVLKDATDHQVGEFLDALELFGLGASWGGYMSLAMAVDTSDRTIAKGSNEGRIIRLQIGLEDTQDLVNDIDKALAKIR